MSAVGRDDRVVRLAGIVVVAVLGCVVVFQLLLAAGVPWGSVAYGGQPAHLPVELRATSAVAAFVWTLVGLVVLRRAGITGTSVPRWLRVVSWVIVAVLAVSVVLNAITPSALERAIWLPVTVVMLAGLLVIVLRG